MSITLSGLVIGVAIAAIVFSIVVVGFKKHKSYFITYLQSFVGILFLFSGAVKAIDPLGTAYKMDQYFNEFVTLFEGTWLSGISGIFPVLSNYSIGFSVVMIVLEILLGIMLLTGAAPKLTSWFNLILIIFFTFLTGFTYLTGYVPAEGRFFDFDTWGAYKATNMKVTDCGCFGDFLKLEPKVSFFKDVFLLIPAIIFIFTTNKFHQLFSKSGRLWINAISVLGLIYFCMSNYVWNLPIVDFRPFKIGTDVAARYKAETDAAANVKEIQRTLKNDKTGEEITLPYVEYMKNYAKYGEEWKTIDVVKSEPTVKATKISNFKILDFEGSDMNFKYLENEKNHFMLVSHKIGYEVAKEMITVKDSIFTTDTIYTATDTTIKTSLDTVLDKQVEVAKVTIEPKVLADYMAIKPFLEEAIADGQEASIVLGGATKDVAKELQKQIGVKSVSVYEADDILLKTIIRSNPGIVLWKNGKVIYMWHKKQLPGYAEVKTEYIK